MEQLFITVTNGTNAHAHYGACPAALDALDTILGEPLKPQLPNVALAISVGSSRRRNMRSQSKATRQLAFPGFNQGKAVMEGDVRHNGVNSSRLNGLETGAELLDNVGVTPVKAPKKRNCIAA